MTFKQVNLFHDPQGLENAKVTIQIFNTPHKPHECIHFSSLWERLIMTNDNEAGLSSAAQHKTHSHDHPHRLWARIKGIHK